MAIRLHRPHEVDLRSSENVAHRALAEPWIGLAIRRLRHEPDTQTSRNTSADDGGLACFHDSWLCLKRAEFHDLRVNGRIARRGSPRGLASNG